MVSLAVGFALSAFCAAEDHQVRPNRPGHGQLFVGSCYQPIDRTPEEIGRDIAIM
jgi:beta-galactosidase